jgi:hypothetical protein
MKGNKMEKVLINEQQEKRNRKQLRQLKMKQAKEEYDRAQEKLDDERARVLARKEWKSKDKKKAKRKMVKSSRKQNWR